MRYECQADISLIPLYVLISECGQPDIYYWDIGYFSYHGTTLFADCAYYRTYTGTLNMTCDNITKTWVTAGECQEYSTYKTYTSMNCYIVKEFIL